jgi:hypothetical protein
MTSNAMRGGGERVSQRHVADIARIRVHSACTPYRCVLRRTATFEVLTSAEQSVVRGSSAMNDKGGGRPCRMQGADF